MKNQDEAVKIVVAADTSGSATAEVQKRQMENVAKLITTATARRWATWSPPPTSAR